MHPSLLMLLDFAAGDLAVTPAPRSIQITAWMDGHDVSERLAAHDASASALLGHSANEV